MGAQCSCQVPEEVDANEEFPLTPSKEYYSSKHGDCFQVGEDASYTVRSAGSTSIPSDECSCPNDSKELGFKETDSQEDFMLTVQSSRSCRSYHLAGLPGDDGLSQASKGSLARLQMLVEGADFLGAEVELTKLMDELADPAFADERAIISASPLVMHIKDELRLYREVKMALTGTTPVFSTITCAWSSRSSLPTFSLLRSKRSCPPSGTACY